MNNDIIFLKYKMSYLLSMNLKCSCYSKKIEHPSLATQQTQVPPYRRSENETKQRGADSRDIDILRGKTSFPA